LLCLIFWGVKKPIMTEDELEKVNQADFIENAQDDIDDLMSGRIKSPEHLEAVSTLLDKLLNLSSSVDSVSEASEKKLYNLVNSKSIEELKTIFDKLDDFQKWFNENLEGFL